MIAMETANADIVTVYVIKDFLLTSVFFYLLACFWFHLCLIFTEFWCSYFLFNIWILGFISVKFSISNLDWELQDWMKKWRNLKVMRFTMYKYLLCISFYCLVFCRSLLLYSTLPQFWCYVLQLMISV